MRTRILAWPDRIPQ